MTAVCSCKGFKVSDNIVEWLPAEGSVCVRNFFNVSRHTGQRELTHSATSLETRKATFHFALFKLNKSIFHQGRNQDHPKY